MEKKKIYIAKRIPKNPKERLVLSINPSMKNEDIHSLYIEKIFVDSNYIYNGPWILRPPVSENDFSENKMPSDLKPFHIWNMVKEKIESSDIVVGIISGKSYGTIAEVGYACKIQNIAVYVLPEVGIEEGELQDLWFLFQMAKGTKDLWSDNDIKNISEFESLGISSIKEYEDFLGHIIPNFMKL